MKAQLRGRAAVVILVIDHIGGHYLSIRRRDNGLVIRVLNPLGRPGEIELNEPEWIELVGLVMAVKAASDFQEG